MSSGFIGMLSQRELGILRGIVRKVHMAYWPKDCTDDIECDRLIESLGPEVVERMIKFGVDRGLND